MAKVLASSLRERNRYIVFEILSNGRFDRKAAVDAVWDSLLGLFGEVGVSKTSIWVMDWERDKSKGIIKVNHRSVDMVRSALTLIKNIDNEKAAVNVAFVSGTLKGARKHL